MVARLSSWHVRDRWGSSVHTLLLHTYIYIYIYIYIIHIYIYINDDSRKLILDCFGFFVGLPDLRSEMWDLRSYENQYKFNDKSFKILWKSIKDQRNINKCH